MGVIDPPGISLPAADSRFPRMPSIVARGADPTGADVDARVALDATLMDALHAGQGMAWLPMGAYRLKSTFNPSDRSPGQPALVLDKYLRGFTWFGGYGKIGYPPTGGGGKYYAAPEMIWYGTLGGVMWEFDSIGGSALIGIAFRGRPTSGASNRAGVGLNISQRGALVGSGLHLLERVTFNDLTTGVRFGDGQETSAGNCDTTTFRDVTFQSCDVAVDLTHQQNLVYNFEGTSAFISCKTAVRSTAGGYLNIADLNANNAGGTGPDEWMLDLSGGHYAGTHKVSRARLEAGCQQFLRTKSRYTDVLIEGLTEAQDSQDVTMFDLTGGQVTLIGGCLTTHSASAPTFNLKPDAGSGGLPSVRLYGVRLDTPRFLYEEWFTHAAGAFPAVTMRDCENQYGQRIPSFSTRLEDGLPVPLRAVTTDGTTDVTTTLLNNGLDQRADNCCAIGAGAYRVRMTLIGTTGTGGVAALQVRLTREADVVHDGTTITMSTPDVIGTDFNPDSLVCSFNAVQSYKYIRAVVRGKAATTIQWRAEFQLIAGTNNLTLSS